MLWGMRGRSDGSTGGGVRAIASPRYHQVYVSLRAWVQDGTYKRSALHVASYFGLVDTVAKLLSLGADATLTDEVRACT